MASLPRRKLQPYRGKVKFGVRPALRGLLTPNIAVDPVSPRIPPPPDMTDWIGSVTNWGVMGNDYIGDCVVACFGHLIESWTGATGNRRIITDQSVIAAYTDMTGYNPATRQPDPGLVISSAMNYWRTTGIAGHKIDLAADANTIGLPATYYTDIRYAVYYYGAAILALDLPEAAIPVFYQGGIWDINMGPAVNLHCVPVLAYDSAHCDVITWGRPQRMTWGFISQYTKEIWAAMSADWIGPTGVSPTHQTRQYLDTKLPLLLTWV